MWVFFNHSINHLLLQQPQLIMVTTPSATGGQQKVLTILQAEAQPP